MIHHRNRFGLALVAAIVLSGIPAWAEPFQEVIEAEDDKALAAAFFKLVDFSKPMVADLKPMADSGRALEALNLWRDRMVTRLRAVDYGRFNWHGSYISPSGLAAADLWVGRTPPSGVNVFNIHETHLEGLCGDPERPTPILWTTDTSKLASGQETPYFESSFRFFTLLIGAYWKSGDPIYLKKWHQILGDFLRHERAMAASLDKNDYRNWKAGGNAGALRTASRMIFVTRSLAAVAKMIPDKDKSTTPAEGIPDWDLVNLPRTAPVASASSIPAPLLARWAASMVKDHADYMIELYVTNANRVPNQRFEGIVGCVVALTCFRELSRAQGVLLDPVNRGLGEYLGNSLNLDGTVLEQAFNYNPGTYEGLAMIRTMAADLSPGEKTGFPAVEGIEHGLAKGERVFDLALLRPVRAPKFLDNVATVGGGGIDESRKPWKDPASTNWRQITKERPDFTSVALPYGGYYALRGGWDATNLFVFMQNSRRARGHLYPNNLGIEMSSYGRHLLIPGGFPWYTAGMAPADQRAEFKAFYEYFGENRPLNRNVVLVDGFTQHKRNRDGSVLTAGAKAPLPGRWHASPAFDVVDGTWDGGWFDPALGASAESENTKAMAEVVHERRLIHLRELGWVLVADRVTAGDGRDHTLTQVWNFPPKIEGPKPVNGFADGQIETATDGHEIATRDPDGPNLLLSHFGPVSRQYERFHGAKGDRYRGWYLMGAAVPKTDVHVHWKLAGAEAPLWTLLAPSPGLEPTVKTRQDTSAPGRAAFTAVHVNGKSVFAALSTDGKPAAVGPLQANAAMVVYVQDAGGDSGRGVVIGGRRLSKGADLPIPGADFEFEIRGGKWLGATPIRTPTTFDWVRTEKGTAPKYW